MSRKTGAIIILIITAIISGAMFIFHGSRHHYFQQFFVPAAIEREGLSFYHPRIYALLPGSDTTAGYVFITNNGTDKTLSSVSAKFAGTVEIHETTTDENGISRMRRLSDGIHIPTGERIDFAPGGMHLMFFDSAGLADSDQQSGGDTKSGTDTQSVTDTQSGTDRPVVLFFSGGQAITVNFRVIKRGEEGETSHEQH